MCNFSDDTNSNSSFHISDSESTKWGILFEWFNTHSFGWFESDESGVGSLDTFGFNFSDLTGSSVLFIDDFFKFTSNMRSMAIEDWGVTVMDFSWVTEDDDLSVESSSFLGGLIFIIGAYITSFELFDSNTSDIETDVVTGDGLVKFFMMHFYRFDFRS